MRHHRTQWVILGLLSHEPLSGYDIRRHIDESIGFFWRESYGQIYPVLARLARRGLVRRTVTAAARGGRRRHSYAITPAGRDALAAWLREPPEPEIVRNELLLKTFFSDALAAPILRSHIQTFLARQRALARYYAHGAAEIDAVKPARRRRAWSLTLRAGQLIVAARIHWAEEALAALGNGRSSS
ncbi:MAG TPA: PadR family transcriptional regulator [Gemmatimonadaceae bacterium]|nr:PadR family transcriptional regulator [Gemmatimonadaceae bacterium]